MRGVKNLFQIFHSSQAKIQKFQIKLRQGVSFSIQHWMSPTRGGPLNKVSANSTAKDLQDVMDRDAKFSKSEFKTFLKNYQENKKSEIASDWAKEFNETRGSTLSGATATGAAELGSTWTDEFSEFTDSDFEKFLGQILKNLFML